MITVEMLLLGLLAMLALILVLSVILGISIKCSLNRIENKLTKLAPQSSGHSKPGASAPDQESSGNTAFDAFIAEDPSRQALSKSEQAAAFREWRREKGMNWSNS